MGEQVKLLRQKNQDLKKQLSEIQTNLISIQKEVNYEKQRGAGKKQRTWSHSPSLTIAQPDTKPNENDVHFLKGQCHAIWQLYKNLKGVLASLNSKTNGLGLLLKTI